MKLLVVSLIVCGVSAVLPLSDHACQCKTECKADTVMGVTNPLGTKYCQVDPKVCTDLTSQSDGRDKCGDGIIDSVIKGVTDFFNGSTFTDIFSKVGTWTTENLQKIPISDIQSWTKEQIEQIPFDKIKELTADQIKNLNTSYITEQISKTVAAGQSVGSQIMGSATAQQLKGLTADTIKKLTSADWTALASNLGAVGQWTKAQLQSIPDTEIAKWTKAQLDQIPFDQIKEMTVEQIKNVDATYIADQVNKAVAAGKSVGTQIMGSATAAQLKGLTADAIKKLTAADWTALASNLGAVGQWTKDQIALIPSTEIGKWTAEQLKKIPVDEIVSFTKEQIAAIPFDQLKQMTKEQLAKIPPEYYQSVLDKAKAAGENIGNFAGLIPTVDSPTTGASSPTTGAGNSPTTGVSSPTTGAGNSPTTGAGNSPTTGTGTPPTTATAEEMSPGSVVSVTSASLVFLLAAAAL